jgi:cob(I)alamin adenosyltransferase
MVFSSAEIGIKSAAMGKAEAMESKGHNRRKGLVIVNTGNGKGKTSAAMGVLLRAWGRGMRVAMRQFIKHSTANFGEHRAARKIGVEIKPMGDGFTWLSKDKEATRQLALDLWKECKEKIFSGEHDILILDEFTYPLHYGWIPVEDVLETLQNRPPELHVIITGRYAPPELIEFADLVTEMREVKHPYRLGIKAQPGIDF